MIIWGEWTTPDGLRLKLPFRSAEERLRFAPERINEVTPAERDDGHAHCRARARGLAADLRVSRQQAAWLERQLRQSSEELKAARAVNQRLTGALVGARNRRPSGVTPEDAWRRPR